MNRFVRCGAAILLAGALSACSSSSPSSDRTVTLSWAPNRDSGVNKAGGGYLVTIADRRPIDVPWITGTAAPTSLVVRLSPGTYMVTVAAYAALDAEGGATGSVSAPSQPITVQVP